MKTTEKQELKNKLKRIGLFVLIVFLPICIVCTLLYVYVPGIPPWLVGMVLVIMMFVSFFFYTWIMGKLDKKKAERISKKKDPFSD